MAVKRNKRASPVCGAGGGTSGRTAAVDIEAAIAHLHGMIDRKAA